METLREILDEAEEEVRTHLHAISTLCEFGPEARAEHCDGFCQEVASRVIGAFRALIESWAYGEERECPRCGGSGVSVGKNPGGAACPLCHGTGKTRGPGLVERAWRRAEQSQWDDLHLMEPLRQHYLRTALRQELGSLDTSSTPEVKP